MLKKERETHSKHIQDNDKLVQITRKEEVTEFYNLSIIRVGHIKLSPWKLKMYKVKQ